MAWLRRSELKINVKRRDGNRKRHFLETGSDSGASSVGIHYTKELMSAFYEG